MNAHEAVALHKQRFPEIAETPLEVLLMFAQEIAREEKRQADEMQEHHCAVCFCLLSEQEAGETGPAAFHRTCTEHAKWRKSFNLSKVRANHGIPHWHKFPPFWKFDVRPLVPPMPPMPKKEHEAAGGAWPPPAQ